MRLSVVEAVVLLLAITISLTSSLGRLPLRLGTGHLARISSLVGARAQSVSLKFKAAGAETTVKQKVLIDVEEEEGEFNDEFEDEVIEEEVERPNVLLTKLSKGLVPLAASIGFAATPSPLVAARIAGAAAGSVAGLLAKKMVLDGILKRKDPELDDDKYAGVGQTSAAFKTCVKEALKKDPIQSHTTVSLERIAKRNGLPENELSLFFSRIFAEVVYRIVNTPSLDLLELVDIIEFAEDNGFSKSEVADGITLAALRVGTSIPRDEIGVPLNTTSVGLHEASKLYFLAEKMMGVLRGFYGGRVKTSLVMYRQKDYLKILREASVQVFKRFVETVLVNPTDFSADEVTQMREYLTTPSLDSIRADTIEDLIMETVNHVIETRFLVHADKPLEATLEHYENFAEARRVFNWREDVLQSVVDGKTMPIFQLAARQVLIDVIQRPEIAEEKRHVLLERAKALKVTLRKAQQHLREVVGSVNKVYNERLVTVYDMAEGKLDQVYRMMIAYHKQHEAMVKVCEDIVGEDDWRVSFPGLPFAEAIRTKLYKLHLQRGPKAHNFSEEVFSLTEETELAVKKLIAIPKLISWLTQIINEDGMNEDASVAYQNTLQEYGITDDDWQPTIADFYYQEMLKVANAKAIPTAEEVEKLDRIRQFVNVSEQAAKTVILDVFGNKYLQAVKESMNPTGIISEEYVEALERLRERLKLSEQDAGVIFAAAVRSVLSPMVKSLQDLWKSDTDVSYRREKAMKEAEEQQQQYEQKGVDPGAAPDAVLGFLETGAKRPEGGTGVFMREVLNLVDFVVTNYAARGVDLASVFPLPVTATGVVPEEDLIGIYKYFLITMITERDTELRARYQTIAPVFGKILGFEPEGLTKVKYVLAYTAFKNMLKNVFRNKPVVEPSDLQLFNLLKEGLQLPPEVAQDLYDVACKDAVVEYTMELIRPEDYAARPLINAELARRLRQQTHSLGLDFEEDLKYDSGLLTLLFVLEVQYAVENELLDDIAELQEIYRVPEDVAAKTIEGTCKRYLSQLISLGLRAARRYREEEAVNYVKQIKKYAKFVGGSVDADARVYTDADKRRMISFYLTYLSEKAEAGEPVEDDGEGALSLLDRLIHLTIDFVPPLEGVPGLLGNIKTFGQLYREAKYEPTMWS